MAQGYDEDRRKGHCCCHFGSGCGGRRRDDWNAKGKAQLAHLLFVPDNLGSEHFLPETGLCVLVP